MNEQHSNLSEVAAQITIGVGLGAVVGLVMSVVSNGFVGMVETLTLLRDDMSIPLQIFAGYSFNLVPLGALLAAACLILIVRRVFGITRWHGPADSIFAAHRTDNDLDVRSGLGSTLAAFISASGGASVGQYGPLVHFGATVGSILRRMTGDRMTTDVFIGCGVAGAIAAGFNAPIAGIVFAHEAILRHFSMRAIVPISIASLSSVWFSEQLFGASTLFSLPNASIDYSMLFPVALICGLLFGIIAVGFMLAVRTSAAMAAGSGWAPWRLCLAAAVITGLVGGFVPEVLGLGTGPLGEMLNGGFLLEYLIVLFGFKILLTAVCIGFGLFGGLFSPALFIGAAAGAAIGRIVESVAGLAAGSALAICGMAAVASAVIGAPIAGVIIILELTMSYELAVCAMLSVVVCVMVSYLAFGHSFFDRQLLDRGIDVTRGRGQIEMMERSVATIASPDFASIEEMLTVSEAIGVMNDRNVVEGYVLNDRNQFLGKVSLKDLIRLPATMNVMKGIHEAPISIKQDASLLQAIEVASQFVGESIPIIDRDTNEMVGVVTEADLFSLYLSLQRRVADLERS